MLRSKASHACIFCNTTVHFPHRALLNKAPAHLHNSILLINPLRCRQARVVHIKAVSAEATIPTKADATSIATLPVSWYTLLRVTPGLEQQEYEFALNSLTRRRPTQLRLHSKTLESRDAVLKQAKLNVVDPKSREMYDQLQVPSAYVEVLLKDVPGALCLLYEATELQVLVDAGLKFLNATGIPVNKEAVEDAAVLTASALFTLAEELSQPGMSQDLTAAYDALQDGEKLLLQHSHPNSTQLLTSFRNAQQAITPSVALALLSLPLGVKHAAERQRGLALLKEWLVGSTKKDVGQAGSFAMFLQNVRKQLTSSEEAQVLNLLRVDSRSDVREVYEVALYYVAQGCRSFKPELVEDAARLLSQCIVKEPDRSPLKLDIQVGLASCLQLLGRDEEALSVLGMTGTYGQPADPAIMTFFEEANEDPKATLRLLANRWLSDIAFNTCRDAAPEGPFSVERWLQQGSVQVHNSMATGRGVLSNVLSKAQPGALLPALAAATAVLLVATAINQRLPPDALKNALQRVPSVSLPKPTLPSLPNPPTLPRPDLAAAGQRVHGWLDDVSAQARAIAQRRGLVPTPATVSTSSQLTRQHAAQVVSEWQRTKAQALGKAHNTRKLDGILTGSMLKQWQQRAADVRACGWHWEYTLNKMTVDSVRDVAPGAVKVSASFDEVASIVEAGQVQESYQNKYSIQYDVVKRGNKWMIERGLILDS